MWLSSLLPVLVLLDVASAGISGVQQHESNAHRLARGAKLPAPPANFEGVWMNGVYRSLPRTPTHAPLAKRATTSALPLPAGSTGVIQVTNNGTVSYISGGLSQGRNGFQTSSRTNAQTVTISSSSRTACPVGLFAFSSTVGFVGASVDPLHPLSTASSTSGANFGTIESTAAGNSATGDSTIWSMTCISALSIPQPLAATYKNADGSTVSPTTIFITATMEIGITGNLGSYNLANPSMKGTPITLAFVATS